MQESSQSIIDRANSLIQNKDLQPKAKALLLLKLTQLHALFSSENAIDYWQQLVPMRGNITGEDKIQLDELGLNFEEGKTPTKGFAGEKIAEIKNIMARPNVSEFELRAFLDQCETEVSKKLWPGGKQAIWEQLVLAWKTIDRKKALMLTAKLSGGLRQTVVRRMNQEATLTLEEWRSFIDTNNQNEAVKIILAILDDPQAKLTIPNNLVVPVIRAITANLHSINQLGDVLGKIDRFVPMVASTETWTDLYQALKDTAIFFGNSPAFGNQWAERFNATFRIMVCGVMSGVITRENIHLLEKGFPNHILDFAKASCFSYLCDESNAREVMAELIASVTQKDEAKAWFLVVLTDRHLGHLAYQLAKESPQQPDLLPRIRRGWLINDPTSASAHVDLADLEREPIGQILYRATIQERVTYLQSLTDHGSRSLPGGLWAAEKQKEEDKGFWASLWSGSKTLEEVVNEYLVRNPLYNSYKGNTPPAQQFTEKLRFSGYGEYSAQQLDPILLETLVAWGDVSPDEVRLLLKKMWQAIEPDENLLRIDFLRNAIFSRCTTVLAGDPVVLSGEFVPWLKRKLVDNALVWQSGKTQFTVRYPPTALASMCIQGALAVQHLSPARRDQLVETAVTRYQVEEGLAQVAAQLYNTGKQPLDLNLPWKPVSKILDGWQVGIVRNAIPTLVQAFVESHAAPQEEVVPE